MTNPCYDQHQTRWFMLIHWGESFRRWTLTTQFDVAQVIIFSLPRKQWSAHHPQMAGMHSGSKLPLWGREIRSKISPASRPIRKGSLNLPLIPCAFFKRGLIRSQTISCDIQASLKTCLPKTEQMSKKVKFLERCSNTKCTKKWAKKQ